MNNPTHKVRKMRSLKIDGDRTHRAKKSAKARRKARKAELQTSSNWSLLS